ncbi:conjugative transposon protein TraN [Flavobacterium sp. MFBS3-15]|uniref:conjugative transposon protein TraN n=1 Tax=Flavobacterium sp. MFBS3-15 TaxID=2989816 RepID=UPI002236A907|nr:conjugative transposon protein TraN [Flavobacterium sp. MFBS3-15]MCW4470231.1 conjugative transposon protein TraN [Flavobacterium sp. MFBS3-15]
MKIQQFTIAMLVLLCGITYNTQAQVHPDEVIALGKVEPYAIEVTYEKTSHIIFPSGIRYVDMGSDNIVAGKAEDADNVLRVKAAVAGFPTECNFSVITEDGQFYSFDVCYSDHPVILGHNLSKGMRSSSRKEAADIRFESLGTTPATLTGLLMEALYNKNARQLKAKSEGYGITFSLRGIYIHGGKYYFHIQTENTTHVPFTPDFIRFAIVDRKVAKRTVVQERTLEPLRLYKPLLTVEGHSKERNVYLLDVFTLTKGQVLEIEMVEKNGGRGQRLKVRNADLLKAEPLTKLRLKF